MNQIVNEVNGLITITITLRREEVEALQKANEKFCLKELIGAMVLLKILDLPMPKDYAAGLGDLFQ